VTELSTHRAPSPPLNSRTTWNLALTGLALTLAFAAVMLALRSNADRQVTFASHERVFVEPGGRLIYYPQRREAVIKGWLMSSLSPAQIYQVWRSRPARPAPSPPRVPPTSARSASSSTTISHAPSA